MNAKSQEILYGWFILAYLATIGMVSVDRMIFSPLIHNIISKTGRRNTRLIQGWDNCLNNLIITLTLIRKYTKGMGFKQDERKQ